MSHIFISYSQEDRPVARIIADALAAEGVPVWWDRAIKAGENFDEILEEKLRDSLAVVVLWSKKSAASKWVRAEATVGQRKSALVPALIEDCERPLAFELVHTADLRRWKGDRSDPHWRGFVSDLRSHAANSAKRQNRPVAETQPPAAKASAPAQKAAAAPAAPRAPASENVTVETTFWQSVKDSSDRADFEAYLERYPKGHFAPLARNRLAQFGAETPSAPPTPVMPAHEPPAAKTPAEPLGKLAEPSRASRAAGPRGPLLLGGAALALALIAGLIYALLPGGGEKPAVNADPPQTDETVSAPDPATSPVTDESPLRGAADETADAIEPAEVAVADSTSPLVTMSDTTGSGPIKAETSDETAIGPGRDCAECPDMIALPGGSFLMGSPDDEPGRYGYEGPQREVTLRAFAIGKTEVTFNEWEACVEAGGCDGYNPGDEGWGRGMRPAVNISWNDANAYVRWLSQKTGKTYRLPTEAEWEYAARGGTATAYSWGAFFDPAQVPRGKTDPVGNFPPNAFGLFDTHGNAREWVADCYVSMLSDAPSDGSAATTGDCTKRVIRGGSYRSAPQDMRVANRGRLPAGLRDEYLGFRVVRED